MRKLASKAARKLRSSAFAVAVVGAAIVATPAPAAAYPTNCSILTHPVFPAFGKAAHCASGTGTFRIVLRCHGGFNSGYYYYYGEWVRPGDYSMTACLDGPAGGFLVSYYISKRG